MKWDTLHEIPRSLKAHEDQSLVRHIAAVARIALSIGDVVEASHGRAYRKDILLAGCLLHDASKALEMEPSGARDPATGLRPAKKSAIGENIQHGVYAAHKALSLDLPLSVVNLIISHTHASSKRCVTWEGALLFYADYADTDAMLSARGETMFLERWNLAGSS